ncbi:MAG: WG repeat-containing protein [Clostridia bacterium]
MSRWLCGGFALLLCAVLALGACAAAEDGFLVTDDATAAVAPTVPTAPTVPASGQEGGVTIIVSGGEKAPSAGTAANDAPAGEAEARDPVLDAEYEQALGDLQSGALIDALNAFASIGSYRDAVSWTNYLSAQLSYLRNDPRTAAEGFAALGHFADAEYQKRLCVLMQLHRCYQSDKFGYVTLSGEVRIPPAYDWAERVFREESRAPVIAGDPVSQENSLLPVALVFSGTVETTAVDIVPVAGKYGLLRRDGTLIVPTEYDEALWTRSGVAAMRLGKKVTLYNLVTGERLGDGYDEVGALSEGLIPVRSGEQWGYLNASGELLPGGLQWDSALAFSQGLAGVSKGGKAGFINASGDVAIALQHQDVRPFGEGLAAYRSKNRWGFLNRSGETVIEPAYADAGSFQQGACAVKKSGKWGLINAQNELVLKYKYDEITPFDPIFHRAWVRSNKLWGLVNNDGTVIVKPSWASYTPFGAEGMSRVSYRGKYGYMDSLGVTRIANQYEQAAPFSAGYGGVLTEAGQVEYLNRFSRGFAIDSDVPTEALCGFLEARKITPQTKVVLDENGVETTVTHYTLTYALYPQGK